MKNITKSLIVISAVAALAIGGTIAYFSDTEQSTGNTFTAGTIDIAVDTGNPWESTGEYIFDDMKPGGHTETISFTVKNVGTNPANIWKRIKITAREDNLSTEPECDAIGGSWTGSACTGGTQKNDIDKVIHYDMTAGGTTVIDKNWGIMMSDVDDIWVPIATLQPNEEQVITQNYQMDASAGNEYQGDKLTFDMTLYAEQYMGTGPAHTTRGVVLENKSGDPHWTPIIDGTWGILTWDGSGNYTLKAWGLNNGFTYRIAYWNGSTEAGVSAYTAPASGALTLTGIYTGFNTNPADAKYWLRPNDWDNGKTLWEANLVD